MSFSSNTKPKRTDKINVYSSLVYVGVVSSIMFFAGLSSAVLVRKMDKFWVNIHLPEFFMYSTLVILISSLTLIISFRAAKKGNLKQLKGYLILSLILGFSFCVFQYFGWKQYYNSGNAVKSFITYVYGQYGQTYYLTKDGDNISYNGNNYEIDGVELSSKEVEQMQRFAYQICGDDYGYKSKKIAVKNYNKPFAVHRSTDNKQVQFNNGSPFIDNVNLSEVDRDELFKFAFGIYQNKPFFMLEGEYGKDFSFSLNGEDLYYDKKRLFFPERRLNDQEIKSIEKTVFQGGQEYIVRNGEVTINGETVDLAEFETYFMLNNGIEIELKNGVWTQLRQELNSTQYGEFFQTTNVSSSFVWVLTVAHFLHILLGLTILLVVFIRSTMNKYNENNQAGLKAGSIFWHFIGLLWVYLYVFLEYIN
ncbi:MAG: hypothetical protein CL853_01670 [Crocinitomicaceae bacterium]|nr:hypothetical protein [Crocinitomicaceae bacterium]